MNRILLAFILITLSINAQSQNIGIGSKWIYSQNWFNPWINNEEERTIEIVSDTLVDNKLYYVLSGNCECSTNNTLILRWENNQILQLLDSTISVLYDFNLNKGDSLIVSFPANDTILTTLVLIDSTELINGSKFQHISVSQDSPDYQYTDWFGTFVEEIGSINWCITPQAPLCENGTGGLCRFITTNQDTLLFSDIYNCIISSTIELESSDLKVHPNPSTTFWTIPNTSRYYKYHLYKITGEEIRNQEIQNQSEILIEASHLPAGKYVLTLLSKDGKYVSTKLIKE